MEIQVVKTGDGSNSLFIPHLNEHYHSIHGAVQESMHVFIRCGLLSLPMALKAIRIFEMGFGTGLNALLTYYHTIGCEKQIDYVGIDTFPIGEDIIAQLNYDRYLDHQDAGEVFRSICESRWNESTKINHHFSLTKLQARIEEYYFHGFFDLVYFDAFSPLVQPECWTPEVFDRIYRHMNTGGILVTYSSKGSVKRALLQAGFSVEKLPGPPGKREILRGRKS
jgi:tRNA U34 5-methylaminomethyl-2-thiouridine-forming methyltransferase MnmC